MYERTHDRIKTIRPLKDGVIADFRAAELMIRGMIKMIPKRRGTLFKPTLKMVIGIPSGSTEVEIRAVKDSAEQAGGQEIFLLFEPMAAALGIGLDVEVPEGNMVAKLIKGLYKNTTIALQIIFSAKRSNPNTRYNKNKECYRNEHTLCFHYLII